MKNKSAFTLIELLVYMAILGFVIVVAGQVFSDSTVMRVRSQNMVKAAEEVGRVANLMREDISQTGAKAWGQNVTGVYTISYNNDFIYINPSATNPDLSSFRLYREAVPSEANSDIKFDSLVFRKVAFSNAGAFLGVREIKWEVNSKGELRRWCKTVNGTPDAEECPNGNAQEVLVAGNVRKFSFFPSTPGVMPTAANTNAIPRDTVFPLESTNPNARHFNLLSRPANNNTQIIESSYETVNGGTIANINSFAQNTKESFENPATTDRYNEVYLVPPSETQITNCMNVPIRKGETYVVEFNMPFLAGNLLNPDAGQNDSLSTQFLPGIDHFAVGLRASDGSRVPGVSSDVLLYAPQSAEAASKPRYAEFTAKDAIAANRVCVALTFSFYSPRASRGKLRFSDFKVYKKPTGAYHFVKESNNYEINFAKVHATEDDNTSAKLSNKRNVKAFELLLEIDWNGEIAGSYSKESTGIAIPVPNNGVTL